MRGGGGGGGGRVGRQQSHDTLPTSHWNIDGDDLNRVDIEVRWAWSPLKWILLSFLEKMSWDYHVFYEFFEHFFSFL